MASSVKGKTGIFHSLIELYGYLRLTFKLLVFFSLSLWSAR